MAKLGNLGNCPMAFGDNDKKLCAWCGKPLTGRQRRWCSDHGDQWYRTHTWTGARGAALKRDEYKCVICGDPLRLEVNHIEPRKGKGYGNGCWHHPENLETLCHAHHLIVTAAQRKGWTRSARELIHYEQTPMVVCQGGADSEAKAGSWQEARDFMEGWMGEQKGT